MLYYQNGSRGFRYFVGFTVCFAAIALLVNLNKVAIFDNYIMEWVQGAESQGLTTFAKGLSLVGSSKFVIGISIGMLLLLYFWLHHKLELILFIWVSLGSQLLNTMMKLWFRRERPNVHRIIEEIGYSFPSGHSMAAFSLYGVIAYLLWRHLRRRRERLALILFVVLMTVGIGWSRIYLGVHYPSDVIGGYAASGAWLMLSIALFEAYKEGYHS